MEPTTLSVWKIQIIDVNNTFQLFKKNKGFFYNHFITLYI